MKIRIMIELEIIKEESEFVPETEANDTAQMTLRAHGLKTEGDPKKWMDNPTAHGIGEDTRENLIRDGIAQEIVDAATVPQLLALQEKYNSQIGRPKVAYGEGRKIHTCARCGAEHRRSLERLNGRCLDCEHIEDNTIEWVTRGV